MRFKKKSQITAVFSLLLAALFVIGAAKAGAYTIPGHGPRAIAGLCLKQQVGQDYTYGNAAQLAMIFDELDENTQRMYLDKAYADDNIAIFAVCLNKMGADSALVEDFAAKAYADKDTAFFSVLAHNMNENQLEKWLERATADKLIAFRLMLLNEAGRDDEWEAIWQAMEQKQLAEYAQLGVSKIDGKYYYQGRPVRIFMDIYANDKTFMTSQTDAQGEVDIKITRDDDGNIISLDYLTAAEAAEIFGDMAAEAWEDDWEEDDWEKEMQEGLKDWQEGLKDWAAELEYWAALADDMGISCIGLGGQYGQGGQYGRLGR